MKQKVSQPPGWGTPVLQLPPSPHLQGPPTVTISLAGPWLRPSPALPHRHTAPHSQLSPPAAAPHHQSLHPRRAHLGPPAPSMRVRGALQALPAPGPPGAAPEPSQAPLLLPPCRPAPSLEPHSPQVCPLCVHGGGGSNRGSLIPLCDGAPGRAVPRLEAGWASCSLEKPTALGRLGGQAWLRVPGGRLRA